METLTTSKNFEPTWQKALDKIEELSKKGFNGEIEVFDYVEEIMRSSQPLIERLLDERVKLGEIKSKDQARKTIAGNNFQFLILELLKLNQKKGNLDKDLIIEKKKTNELIERYAVIKVAEETQKPDIDLIVYKENSDNIIVFSCKTSLRERAGQTYKWKLLLDIAKECPKLQEKYELSYPKEKKVFTGFITPNFYNEITKPQQRGMIKFFDYAYIGKKIEEDFIKPLSNIIDDLNHLFQE